MFKTLFTELPKYDSESSGSTCQPNIGTGPHCGVSGCDPPSASLSLKSPSKRQRDASETTEVAVEAVTARGTKRKSSTDRQSPLKRRRGCGSKTDTCNPSEVPVESVKAHGTKRKADSEAETPGKKRRVGDTSPNWSGPTEVSAATKVLKEASAEHTNAPETPSTTRRKSGCDVSTRACSPSTSRQDGGSSLYPFNTSKDFEAKYVQLDKLGEGGFGSVYAGYSRADDLPVAIKHIPKEDVLNEKLAINGKKCKIPAEVLLMLKVTGGLESPGESAAVALLDWYETDQEVLLVMERPVPSVDLYTYMLNNGGSLEENQAKNIMKQLVEAAIKMHSAGVFHRDIKTENVLVETDTDGPRVRIIDFGCGCLVRKKPFRRFAGTREFAPPEYLMTGRYEAGPTTVWQLGALLYELLNRHKDFDTSEFLRAKVRFLSELNWLNVSQDCQEFLKMCLVVNPEQRASLEKMRQHPWLR